MNEHSYIRSIHRLVTKRAPDLYVWKINDNYQGGVADAYYSGERDHWVEYKYIPALPKRPETIVKLDLSPLQRDWLESRAKEGRTVAVIIGSPLGSVIFPGLAWQNNITTADFISSTVDNSAVVAYILGASSNHR